MKWNALAIVVLLPLHWMSANEEAFPKTPVGTIEVKSLPAARLLVARGEGNFFDSRGGLFRPLFRYIQSNEIAMTVPVAASVDPGEMYFYLGSETAGRSLEGTAVVAVVREPERTVLSIGLRGAYTPEQYRSGLAELDAWLQGQDTWRASGPARAIYWNGPFTPGFLKRAEVHLPLKAVDDE